MTDHPAIDQALKLFNEGQLAEFGRVLADDVIWHVGGDHPLSGTYRGRAAVLDYLGQSRALTGDTLRLEPVDILASHDHAAIFLQATGHRAGKEMNAFLAEAVTFDADGRWAEYWALSDQQDDLDQFWNEGVR
jgi:ketosteroid isomerase-like protein